MSLFPTGLGKDDNNIIYVPVSKQDVPLYEKRVTIQLLELGSHNISNDIVGYACKDVNEILARKVWSSLPPAPAFHKWIWKEEFIKYDR